MSIPKRRTEVVEPARNGSNLLLAAAPVLNDIVERLQDSSLRLTLSDHNSHIVDTRVTQGRPGSADAPVRAYGEAIHHPVTHLVEGALVVTGVLPEEDQRFVPCVQAAVREIEQGLLTLFSQNERMLLAAFEDVSTCRSQAVVVLDEGFVLASSAAVDLLQPPDYAVLRRVAADVGPDRPLVRPLGLASGLMVEVEACRVQGTTGTRFQLATTAPSRQPTAEVDLRLVRLRGRLSAVLIEGEPGSGRTHAVRTIAGAEELHTLDAADVPTLGEGGWGAALEELATSHRGVIAVEEIQLLPEALGGRLADLISRSSARFVLTCAPHDDLPPHVAALAAGCVEQVELPQLRRRTSELPQLLDTMAREHSPDSPVRFTPSALAALTAHSWPGNLRELAMVVRHAVEKRSSEEITLADLPQAYRSQDKRNSLTPWQQAEHDAIIAALRATAGNKLRAARRLGISRSTLYKRIRSLEISV